MEDDILAVARGQVLERGVPLDESQTLAVLELPDDRVSDALALAHEVRMRWCGPAVEVEGIVSIKTGGCPEDCHFCSQSGRFQTPVRAVRLDIPALVRAAHETAATGRDRVLPRGGGARTRRAADGAGARSGGGDQRGGGDQHRLLAGDPDPGAGGASWPGWACTATTTTSRPRVRTSPRSSPRTPGRSGWRRSSWCASSGWRCAAAGSSGWARRWRSVRSSPPSWRRSRPTRCRSTSSTRVPGRRSRTCRRVDAQDALRAIAAFRLALPRTVLRFAGGRELTLGDLGTRQGVLGGINAMIVGNYLTTLGRSPEQDLDLLAELSMPVKALSETL